MAKKKARMRSVYGGLRPGGEGGRMKFVEWKESNENWTKKGEKHIGKRLEDGILDRDTIIRAIKRFDMKPFVNGMQLPAMPGMGIKKIVEDMMWGSDNMLLYGISNELAPYGFYGLTYRYKDVDATSFWIDCGLAVTCVMSIKHEERLNV